MLVSGIRRCSVPILTENSAFRPASSISRLMAICSSKPFSVSPEGGGRLLVSPLLLISSSLSFSNSLSDSICVHPQPSESVCMFNASIPCVCMRSHPSAYVCFPAALCGCQRAFAALRVLSVRFLRFSSPRSTLRTISVNAILAAGQSSPFSGRLPSFAYLDNATMTAIASAGSSSLFSASTSAKSRTNPLAFSERIYLLHLLFAFSGLSAAACRWCGAPELSRQQCQRGRTLSKPFAQHSAGLSRLPV